MDLHDIGMLCAIIGLTRVFMGTKFNWIDASALIMGVGLFFY